MPDGSGGTSLARSLIGRETELAALQEAWRARGEARVVIADAGIGKSRLVRELAGWATAQGGFGIAGRCSPTGSDIPLRPWSEALLNAARAGRRPGPELAPFVPALARVVPEWGAQAEEGSALVLGEAVLRLLSSWATPSATALLVIEDLQWADPESLAVLEYVVDNLAGAPVLVVATLRDGETGFGADLAAGLVARRAALEVRLDPVSDEDVLAIARSCLGEVELPDAAATALLARCDGVPFLVEELVATAVRSGWETVTDDVPGSVAASVETRLANLRPATRPLLIAAALLGRHFDWTIAARAASVGEDDGAELLRLAVQAQLVDVEGAGYRFHHALTRDAVLAGASPADRSTLASRAFDAVMATDPTGTDCAIAASLAHAAGQDERAASLWLEAADWSLDQDALATAETLASRARDTGNEAIRRQAELTLLRTYEVAGNIARATDLGQRLLAVSAEDRDRAAIHLILGRIDLAAGHWDDAEAHAGAARTLDRERASLARADALAAHAALGRAEPDLAVALARSALEQAEGTGQPRVECEALEVIGRAERGRDLQAAEAAFEDAFDRATRAALRVHRARAMQELGTIDMFLSLSPDRLVAARQMAVEAGALPMAAIVDLQLAAVHEARGEVEPALAVARRCEEVSRRWGLSTLPMAILVQGFAYAYLGDRPAAEATIEAALATGEDRHHVEARAEGNVRARLAVVAGDLRAAVRSMDIAMDLVRAHPGDTHVFPGEWALLRTILDDDGDAARAEVAALAVDTPVSRKVLRLAEAVAAGRAGRTEEAEAVFAEVDTGLATAGYAHHRAYLRHLVARAASADGWGDPIAWLRESLATFETNGHPALASRCRALLKDLGAPVPRKGRGDTATVPPALAALGITSREADVLALVAGGATNREVAERLFNSPRTVDKHVERLLQKAGTTRAGLAELARAADA